MKGSNAQLAKIHAMLRQLASDIGEETATLKEQIKKEAMIDKSFADCDTDELNDVIQTILKIGDWSGSNLRLDVSEFILFEISSNDNGLRPFGSTVPSGCIIRLDIILSSII